MDKLIDIIKNENISVKYCNLRDQRKSLYGLYLIDEFAGPIIILDKSLYTSIKLHRCVLAEEIGHYFTAPKSNYLVAYTSYSTELLLSQDEKKALQWAADLLIPNTELINAINSGCHTYYELAEYFNVTEWLLHKKFYLKRIYRDN